MLAIQMTGILKCWCWFWPTCVALCSLFKSAICAVVLWKNGPWWPQIASDCGVRPRCLACFSPLIFAGVCIQLYCIQSLYIQYIYNVFPHYIDVFFMADIFEVLALTAPHTTSRSPMKRPASKVVAAKSVAKSRRRWIGFQLNMVCLWHFVWT